MSIFTLDTSGAVGPVNLPNGTQALAVTWGHLDPFPQGFVEALFASLAIPPFTEHPHLAILNAMGRQIVGFSDLSPEAVELILKDCAAFQNYTGGLTRQTLGAREGARFWAGRNGGALGDGAWGAAFPPITVFLGDDGKVYLK